MRRPITALASAVLGTALAAFTVTVSAQSRNGPAVNPNPPEAAPGGDDGMPAVNPGRGARHLLRNGWDFITYQNYERALELFREAETRRAELTASEQVKLKQGIEAAQRAIREAASGIKSGPSYALSGRSARPGSMAVADPAKARPRGDRDKIQLASTASAGANPDDANVRATGAAVAEPAYARAGGTTVAEVTAPVAAAYGVAVASAEPPVVTTPAAIPTTPDVEAVVLPPSPELGGPATAPAPEPVAAPAASPGPAPAMIVEAPASSAEPVPAQAPVLSAPPETAPAPGSDDIPLPTLPPEIENPQAPADEPAPAPAPEPVPAALSAPAPAAPEPAAAPVPAPAPVPVTSPPDAAITAEAPLPAAVPVPDPLPASPPALAGLDPTEPQIAGSGAPSPTPVPEPEPAPPAESLPVRPETPPAPMAPAPAAAPGPRFGTDSFVPNRPDAGPSGLSPEHQQRVDQIARRQDEEMRRQRDEPPGPADSPNPSSASTRLEITRAPSPTEARPIRAIPVPEEFTPLPMREWNPNRKYWSAAATCHLPLYFQDASLERYGYSVEQHFGRLGRYMSIPIDDPRQSNQRNQIAQPFFSMGLFAAQIALLPYNMFMDPPWRPSTTWATTAPATASPRTCITCR